VQSDRRLVEHVQRADERRAERRREIDALRFAAGQRRRQPIERQVVEADIAQERQPPPDLRAVPSPPPRLPSRRAARLAKNACVSLTVSAETASIVRLPTRTSRGLPSQAGAAALGAREIPTIPAQEHPDGAPCTFSARASEEAADAFVSPRRLRRRSALLVGQLRPRHIETEAALPSRALSVRRVARDSAACSRARSRPSLIDRDGSCTTSSMSSSMMLPKPVAGRARAERVVEREQTRLRRLVRDAARAAFEALGELDPLGTRDRDWALGPVPASPVPVPIPRIANAAPPPSRYDVSIESVRRLRRSPSIRSGRR
jgi:hypothetical protein